MVYPYDGYPFSSQSDSSNNLLQMITEEDDRQKKKQLLSALLLMTIPLASDGRSSPFFCDRLNWPEHIALLNKEGPNAFYKMYRMHYHSYMKLCSLIDESVQKNVDMANRKTGNFASESSIGVITTPLHCIVVSVSNQEDHIMTSV